MKRLTLTTGAAISVVLAFLVFVNVISFGSDRADRWAVIFAFAGLMFCLGVLSATRDTEAITAPAPGVPDFEREVPAAPGSLHGQLTPLSPAPLSATPEPSAHAGPSAPTSSEFGNFEPELVEDEGTQVDGILVDLTVTTPEPDEPNPQPDHRIRIGGPDESVTEIETRIDGFDPETDRSIDPTIVITESGLRDVEVHQVIGAVFTDDDPWDLDNLDAGVDLDAASGMGADLSRLDADSVDAPLHLAEYSDADLIAIVNESEAAVIRSMIRQGQLSSSGPLTDRDIATMIFLAYTSHEMLVELRLRKVTAQPLVQHRAEIA